MSTTVLSLWKGEISKREMMADILAEVADKHGVSVQDITGPARHQRLARVRHEAMWEVRQRTPLSLPQIGRRLGGRDHTTVLHGVRRHASRLDANAAAEPLAASGEQA